MITSVSRAFFQAGSLKAGTPLEIASTPVTAAPPDPNDFSTTNTDAPSKRPTFGAWPTGICPATVDPYFGNPLTVIRKNPTANNKSMFPMKKYVGTAKRRPDSLTPRRFPYAMIKTNPIAIGSLNESNAGIAEASASVPAATDTATVRT